MTKEEFRSAMMQRKMSLDLLSKFPVVARDAFSHVEGDLRLDVVRIRQIQKWFQLLIGAEARNVKIYAKADNGKNLQKCGKTNLVFEAEHATYRIPIVLKEDFYSGETNLRHWYIPLRPLLEYMENTMYADIESMKDDCMRCMRRLDSYLQIIADTEKCIAECIERVPAAICPEFIVNYKQTFEDA